MKRMPAFVGDTLRGWVVILRTIGVVLAVVVSAAVISTSIVYPLWFAATHHRRAYTLLSLVLLGAVMVWSVIGAIVRSRQQQGYTRLQVPVRRRIVRITGIVVVPILAYGAVVLFANGVLAAAIPVSIVLAAAIGFLVTSGNRTTS